MHGSGTAAWIIGLDWRVRYIEEPAVMATDYGAIRVFSSLWHFCFSEDHVWSWHCYLDHRHPGGIKCEGMLAASGTRKLALLESCIASGLFTS